ncbi:MAG: peptidase C1 [Holophagales bacterium]|nr:peptidase C1 [Holophagales bacterium]
MRHLALTALSAALVLAPAGRAEERRDPAVFAEKKDARLDAIKAEVRKKDEPAAKKRMWVDFSKIDAPKAVSEFTKVWHQPPVCQGLSGMCWCFSTTSLLESEAWRLTKREVRLSVLHTVYWEHVEKARGWVKSRGASVYGEGSEPAAVLRALKNHGALPADAYTGLLEGRKEHDHESTLYAEIKAYLDGVKAAGAWNEEAVASTVRAILDHHLGAPPATVVVDGVSLTPKEYLAKVVRLNPDDYVGFLSTLEQPYWEKAEYDVPDNWWHGREYVNVPLDTFLSAIKGAIRNGFSVGIAGDMSEPGYSIGPPGIAVVPAWDIPSAFIDEEARAFRFGNGSTTDDHGLHVVGWLTKGGKDWFLVKDSWSSSWNNDHPGYYFFHEDYVKLKMLAFVVHRDAVKELLAKVKAKE